ncbi:MAG: hypothetical protein L0H24_13470, partial [Microlunatus sp.]|nr:hypothetical protein [Microlunatus sp.]
MSRYGAPRWAGVVLVSMVIGVGLGLAAPSTSPVGEAPALSDLTRTSPTVWVAHLSGLAAGYVAIVLIALMSRWPLLERRIGTGRLIR